jgi:hypothetical protein
VERFRTLADCSCKSQKILREELPMPSWEPAIPQAMQQHGGRNRMAASKPTETRPEPPVRDRVGEEVSGLAEPPDHIQRQPEPA